MNKLLYISLLLLSCQANLKSPQSLQFEEIETGHFVTHHASTGSASWIDYNQDGWADLFIANGYDVRKRPPSPQPNFLYQNDGKGNLSLVENHSLTKAEGFSSAAVWADYDNDGDIDVFIANQRGQNNFFFIAEGEGKYRRDTLSIIANDGGASFSASWVDANEDGFLDLYVANGGMSRMEPDFLYQNLGDGQFAKIKKGAIVTDSLASVGSTWGDYDKDGDLDLFVPNSMGRNALYRNEGDFNFVNIKDSLLTAASKHGFGAASSAEWIDYDNDLDLDLFVSNSFGLSNFLYQNEGDHFTEITDLSFVLTSGNTGNHTWGDFDNDGDLDLIEGNWGAACLYHENNNGQFMAKMDFPFTQKIHYSSTMAKADIDKDGDLDLYIGSWPNQKGEGEPNHFYVNQNKGNNWLKIKFIGTSSNKNGIGAKITLTTPTQQQYREVLPNSNFRSQDELTQHFGLGKEKMATIKVVWPSGKETFLENVSAGQVYEITE